MRYFTSAVIFIFSFISCRNKTEGSKNTLIIKDRAAIEQTLIINNARAENRIGTTWNSEHVKVYGDTTHDKNKVAGVSYKFEPYLSFNDFKVPLFKGNKIAINYASNEIAREYRTMIRMEYKSEGRNFGGHYCFTDWRCGSDCQGSAIVDLETGKVYNSPDASNGYDFKQNSRMLIVNPPDSSGFVVDECAECEPAIWILNERTKKFEERKSFYDITHFKAIY